MANLTTWRPTLLVLTCVAVLTVVSSACDGAQPLESDAAQTEVSQDVTLPVDILGEVDTAQDAEPAVDASLLEDVTSTVDGLDTTDTAEPIDVTSPPDLAVPDVMKEDLSNVDITWTKDIEYIAISQCENCHGVAGGSGLKLYTRQQWIDYFPMIVPSLESGKMPKSGSLAPGQLESIKLWGKVGYPE